MRRLLARLAGVFAAAGAGIAVATVGCVPAGAQSANATVYVVHGIPGVAVDVFVNGKDTLRNFQPKTVAGPLSLPAGSYQITVYKAGHDTGSPVVSETAQVPAGSDVSVVAHLSASGQPTLTPFVNDTSAVAAGQGRLIVRHTAAAPAVDILANRTPALKGLTNGTQQAALLPAGPITAAVVAAGTTTPVLIGPALVTVTAGMDTVVYAVGAPPGGASPSTLAVVTQQIPLAGSTVAVSSGTAGLLEHRPGVPVWAIGVLIAAMLLGAGSGIVLLRARHLGRA